MQPNRSFLFVPGNHPRKLAKVWSAGADAVIVDLEDTVPVADRMPIPAARKAASRAP